MRLHFIEAERDRKSTPTSNWFDRSSHKFFCPSLALPYLAAVTPPDIECKIIDEKIESVDFNDLPDIAAITFKTMSCKKAYEIAAALQLRCGL